MIRHPATPDDLKKEIQALKPTWLQKANARTKKLIQAGNFSESSSIWSEVKPVFILAQSNKCIFCERQFEDPEYGTIEYDVEHFRPKSSVKAWPNSSATQYPFSTGKSSAKGYFWLAYDIENYAASCKNCNTPLKSNYFPIGGQRAKKLSTGKTLLNEKPFLCYPIGVADIDPEELVTFEITTAVPVAKSGDKRRRGQIIIDFFALNEREQLHRDRARMLLLIGAYLEKQASGTAAPNVAKIVDKLIDGTMPHTACARAFKKLWAIDPVKAKIALSTCEKYVLGIANPP